MNIERSVLSLDEYFYRHFRFAPLLFVLLKSAV